MRDLVPCARGSNHVQMRAVQVQADEFPNLPRIADRLVAPDAQIDAIVDGFERTHAWLRTRRDHCTTELAALRDSRIRLLARPTMDYTAILARSLSPERLRSRDAREAGIRADLAYTAAVRFDTVHDLAARETASLSIGDVPRFELGSGDIHCSGGNDDTSSTRTPTIPAGSDDNENGGNEATPLLRQESGSEHAHHSAALPKSPLAAATERWLALDAEDCRLQSASIRERLQQRERHALAQLPRGNDASALLAHGLGIAELLAAAATRDTERGAMDLCELRAWIQARPLSMLIANHYTKAPPAMAVFLAEAAATAAIRNGSRSRDARSTRCCVATCRKASSAAAASDADSAACSIRSCALPTAAAATNCSSSQNDSPPRMRAKSLQQTALMKCSTAAAGLLLAVLHYVRDSATQASRSSPTRSLQQLVARAVRSDDCGVPAHTPGHPLHGQRQPSALPASRWRLARWARHAAPTSAQNSHRRRCATTTRSGSRTSAAGDARLDESSSEQLTTWAWCNGRSGAAARTPRRRAGARLSVL